jgi:glycosyltransferase involved in cell wall biosynthesis
MSGSTSGAQPLRIMLATPYGQDGMGGIDRLNDAIVEGFAKHPELGMRCERLVTRGKHSLAAAQPIFAAALVKLASAAAGRNVDLLHIHLSVRGSSYRKAVLAMLARGLGIPYVIHLHGTDFKEFWRGTNPLLQRELGRMFAGSARIIVLGEYWARVVSELQPAAADKIVILPNATAAAAPRSVPPAEVTRITFLGQLGARKGSADLVDALSRLRHIPDWTATLAGDGDVDGTRQKVASLGLADRVTVPGWISTVERAAQLERSDMLVLPSYAENLPMVILEAFAHGVPVIATPVGAIPEVVRDGWNGFLVAPGDVQGLAAAIERMIRDPALRARMGIAAQRDHAEKFEITRYLERLAAVWTSALAHTSAQSEELNAHSS